MSKPRKPEVTSKRIASIAGKILNAKIVCSVSYISKNAMGWRYISGEDIQALAASALTQTAPKWPALPVKAAPKTKRTKTFMGFDIVVKNKRGPGAKPLGKFKRRRG